MYLCIQPASSSVSLITRFAYNLGFSPTPQVCTPIAQARSPCPSMTGDPLCPGLVKSYPVKAGGVRRLYYCPDCKGYFSETPNTPLANLKTPLSRIVEIVQALNEGLGVNQEVGARNPTAGAGGGGP
jgi:hypothetical protein